MRFTLAGIHYETAEMTEFRIQDPSETTIYIDRECQVFVMTDGNAANLHRADTVEVVGLAEKHGLQELWRAIRCPEPFN